MLKINHLLIQFIHSILINQCENTNNNIHLNKLVNLVNLKINLRQFNFTRILYCRIYKLEAI